MRSSIKEMLAEANARCPETRGPPRGAEQPVLKKSQIKGKIDQQGKNRGDCGRMQAVKLSGMVATV